MEPMQCERPLITDDVIARGSPGRWSDFAVERIELNGVFDVLELIYKFSTKTCFINFMTFVQ